jgi:hypothetical protein
VSRGLDLRQREAVRAASELVAVRTTAQREIEQPLGAAPRRHGLQQEIGLGTGPAAKVLGHHLVIQGLHVGSCALPFGDRRQPSRR